MPPLQIPPQDVDGLIQVRKMGDNEVNELLEALTAAQPIMSRKEFVALLGSAMTSVPAAELNKVLQSLINMSSARLDFEESAAEFAEGVCEAMEQSENDLLRLAGEDCESFRSRLTQLLSAESLIYPAKASSVLYDHDRVFFHARVLTDVRPVFGLDVTEPPKASAIIHMLNITCQHNEGEENIYVAMDSQDLESLIATLERALSKTASLRKLLGESSIALL